MPPSENLRHWDALGKTDPAQTKAFTRAGGFRGTAIKPIWTEKRLTEYFGPCGVGWGCGEPQFTTVPAGEEVLVYCTLQCWYMEAGKAAALYGVGGDKVLSKNKNGLVTDDEAFKKAFTDALGNAFKHLGAGADVHMGLFDDSKYVSEMRREFANDEGQETGEVVSAAQYKVLADLVQEVGGGETEEDKAIARTVFLKWCSKAAGFQVASFADIPASLYPRAKAALESKRQAVAAE